MVETACTLDFDSNYDRKLRLPVFTTIRPDTQSNRTLYEEALDQPVQITHQKDPIRVMRLVDVESRSFGDIPFGLLAMTTGLETDEEIRSLFGMFDIYPADPVLILTLHEHSSSD